MTKCIIVDDEKPARELIELHLSGLQDCALLASFDNAFAAFNFLQKNTADLMFLDIQMPQMSGLQLIKSLKAGPKIILTTAYREYAVEAFELDVLDYLVKPITQERFMKAVARYNHHNKSYAATTGETGSFDNAYIFLKTGREQEKVFLKDILYIEGLNDYIKVHTPTKTIVATERLSYMEEKLPEHKFTRVHKSFIVALDKITKYNTEQITIGNINLPVGRVFKQAFLRRM